MKIKNISLYFLLSLSFVFLISSPVTADPSAPNEAEIDGWNLWTNEQWAQNPFPAVPGSFIISGERQRGGFVFDS